MRILKAKTEIITPISEGGLEELKHIEAVARTCYKSESRATEDGESAKKMVASLIKSGHEAMLEHSTLAVRFTTDRGVTHELVRHRIASFAQESTRYCNYSQDKFGSECTFINITDGIKHDHKMQLLTAEEINLIVEEWVNAMNDAERHYLRMLKLGATPQIARSVLPNSTKTELVITANYREWRNLMKLRADTPAHPQMRELTIPLLAELKTLIPVVFDDIEGND